jgi:rod shape-determining protein MreC
VPRWIKPAAAVFLLIYLLIQILSFRAHEAPTLAPAERVVMYLAAPLQDLGWSAVRGSVNLWQSYIQLIGVSRVTHLLYKERDDLGRRLTEMQEVGMENQRLRALLGFKEREGLKYVFAKRVASGVTPYERTIRVLRGKTDGVRTAMAVLHPAGLVGQVVEASDRSSDVLLLSDLNSAVDAVDRRSRARGILRGSGAGELKLEYITKGDDIAVGDELMTTGLDGVYPKGIFVGTVTKLDKDPKGLFASARVKPGVDFGRVEEVAIVVGNDE